MSRGRLLFAFYRLCMIIIKIKFENGPFFFYSKVNNKTHWALKRPGLHYSSGSFPKCYTNSEADLEPLNSSLDETLSFLQPGQLIWTRV